MPGPAVDVAERYRTGQCELMTPAVNRSTLRHRGRDDHRAAYARLVEQQRASRVSRVALLFYRATLVICGVLAILVGATVITYQSTAIGVSIIITGAFVASYPFVAVRIRPRTLQRVIGLFAVAVVPTIALSAFDAPTGLVMVPFTAWVVITFVIVVRERRAS